MEIVGFGRRGGLPIKPTIMDHRKGKSSINKSSTDAMLNFSEMQKHCVSSKMMSVKSPPILFRLVASTKCAPLWLYRIMTDH